MIRPMKKMQVTMLALAMSARPCGHAIAGSGLCTGIFSDVSFSNESGDGSGLKVAIASKQSVFVTVYEGSADTVRARNVEISGNLVKFDYFQNKFFGQCSKSGISYSDTGGHRGTLRRKR